MGIIGLIVGIVSALPNLIAGVENLFHSQPKSGSYKWIAVEQGLSGAIQLIATWVEKNVPNKKADEVATSVAKFSKAVNDALVLLLNETGLFGHGTTPIQ